MRGAAFGHTLSGVRVQRVQKVQKGTEGFRRVQKGSEGFRRVQRVVVAADAAILKKGRGWRRGLCRRVA